MYFISDKAAATGFIGYTFPYGKITKAIKGRGAVNLPAGRFDTLTHKNFDDDWDTHPDENAASPETVIHWDLAKSVINTNNSPTFLTNYRLIPIAAVNTVVCIALPVRLTLIWDCRRGWI